MTQDMADPHSPQDAAFQPAAPRRTWGEVLRVYLEPAVLRMLLLGFSAGLPLLLVLGTLSFRLREAGIGRATIGYLSWVGLAYTVKWVWAPLVDRLALPFITRRMGRRRSWLVVSQIVIAAGLLGMGSVDPQATLAPLIGFALVVAFASATQDIALDAYRIETAAAEKQAALAAAYQTGYRVAMIWAGAGVLWIASEAAGATTTYVHNAWRIAYQAMAASMAVGLVTTLFSPEPQPRDITADRRELRQSADTFLRDGLVFAWPLAASLLGVAGLLATMVGAALEATTWPEVAAALAATVVGFVGLDRGWGAHRPVQLRVPRGAALPLAWLHVVVYQPFAEFVGRYRRQAVLILALIAIYRISDIVMGIMANPFYVDMGYTKETVATVSKFYGLVMTLLGAFVGGALALRFGVMRVLLAGAVLAAGSNLLFALLATRGADVPMLIFVISADNLSSGIASAAFVAYLSSLTNVTYSATQYALFSSVMLLIPKWLAGFSGTFVDAYGYQTFFVGTAILGVPVLVLVALAARMQRSAEVAADKPPTVR
jgi:MFS transporter, PAT family, beta-lactamase induction signal transducer AmpG